MASFSWIFNHCAFKNLHRWGKSFQVCSSRCLCRWSTTRSIAPAPSARTASARCAWSGQRCPQRSTSLTLQSTWTRMFWYNGSIPTSFYGTLLRWVSGGWVCWPRDLLQKSKLISLHWKSCVERTKWIFSEFMCVKPLTFSGWRNATEGTLLTRISSTTAWRSSEPAQPKNLVPGSFPYPNLT